MTSLHLERHKPAPKGWHRAMCLYPSCRRAGRAGLCAEHERHAVDVHNEILTRLGSDERITRATVNAGYVHAVTAAGTRCSGHGLVMRELLGRPLVNGENVHHVNGNRADNRPQNLELWTSCQPSGQRPDDLAEYARELLGRYGTDEERATYTAARNVDRERVSVHV